MKFKYFERRQNTIQIAKVPSVELAHTHKHKLAPGGHELAYYNNYQVSTTRATAHLRAFYSLCGKIATLFSLYLTKLSNVLCKSGRFATSLPSGESACDCL